jgi:hypothetical protein
MLAWLSARKQVLARLVGLVGSQANFLRLCYCRIQMACNPELGGQLQPTPAQELLAPCQIQ